MSDFQYIIAPDGYEYPEPYSYPGEECCRECGHMLGLHISSGCIAKGREVGSDVDKREHQCACSHGCRSTSEQRIHALQDVAAGMSVLSVFHKDTYRAEVGLTVSGEDVSIRDARMAAYAVLAALEVLEKDHEKEEG